jgi:soluble P-type ATPase
MITIEIPGTPNLTIEHLVLDFNGTLAVDGVIINGVLEMLDQLARQVEIHILTADTFGTVATQMCGLHFKIMIAPESRQDLFKVEYVRKLDRTNVACIGNGRNDRLMMQEAALSIAVLQDEGAAAETIAAAHIVCTSISSALSLFTKHKRIAATMRN